MTNDELRELLLTEVHRLIEEAARNALAKFGVAIPPEARPGFVTAEDLAHAAKLGPREVFNRFFGEHDPSVAKMRRAHLAKLGLLGYPPNEEFSAEELDALGAMQLSNARASLVRKIVAEACATAFFHFFCLIDAVGAPEMFDSEHWNGVYLEHGRDEGPFLHDEFYERYETFRKLRRQ
ncbi:MAG: hypothetical protein IT563_20920 [Alphaproteobacteria bacterium]|nr:hypothetical protein [Alphaproteobacteria bacterium]